MQPPSTLNCGPSTTVVCRLLAPLVIGVGISSGADFS